MKKIIWTLSIIFAEFILTSPALAASPTGYLDHADSNSVSGWAKDDDYQGPVFMHIYDGGIFVDGVQANQFRPDVGSHGFSWTPSDHLSPGLHTIHIYALGVNTNGQLNGENREIGNSPKTITITETRLLQETYFTQPAIMADKVDSTITYPALDHGRPISNTFLIRDEWQDNIHLTWNVGQYTGFTPSDLPGFQRGKTNTSGHSAIQVEGKTVGLFINTDDDPGHQIYGIIPGVWYWDSALQKSPWKNNHNTEISYSFEMKVPFAQRSGGAETYFNPYFLFTDSVTGQTFWYGTEIFDLRDFSNMADFVTWDAGTNVANATARWNGSGFMHSGPGSAPFQLYPWTDYKFFDLRISYEEFTRAIAAVKTKYPSLNLSSDPANYLLVHFNLDAEIYHAPSGSVGKMGLSYRNIRVALYCTANCATTPPPTPKPGDLNGDGQVNIADLRAFFAAFTGIFDYNRLVTNYGK